jgi:GAF domain-containing protein
VSDRREPFAEIIAELTRLVHGTLSIDTALTRIAEYAVATLDECDAADVTLLRDGQPTTLAATRNRALALDDAKYSGAGGPCLDSAEHQRVNRIDATATSVRWEPFCREATRLGIASALTLPLATLGDEPLGALSLYSMRERGFSEEDERIGAIFATHVAAALTSSQDSS